MSLLPDLHFKRNIQAKAGLKIGVGQRRKQDSQEALLCYHEGEGASGQHAGRGDTRAWNKFILLGRPLLILNSQLLPTLVFFPKIFTIPSSPK